MIDLLVRVGFGLVRGAVPLRSSAILILLSVCALGAWLPATASAGQSILILLPRQAHTIVLGSSFQVDGAGRGYHGVEIVGPVSAAVNRPLFSILGTVLDLRIAGGSLVDFEEVGREAGALAPRLYPTLSEQYRWHVIGTVVLVAAQAGLILGLLVERRRRRRAQAELAERLRFEALVADISATFAALPASRVDDNIRDCLRRIVSLLGVDRGTLWQPSADQETLLATHCWSAEGSEPPPLTMATRMFPLARRLGEQANGLSFSSPDELPPEAVAERRAFERLGVRSLLAVTLRIGDRRLGILAFASLRGKRAWPPELVLEIRTLGEVFANALMRKHAATALQTSEALSSAVLTALPGEAAIVDADGVVVQVNDPWAALARSNGHDSLVVPALGASYLDEGRRVATSGPDGHLGRVLELVESVVRGHRDDGVVEYASRRQGEERWFELRAQRLARPAGGAAVMHLDITARKQAEVEAQRYLREMAHMNRVAAMGELASSLAHELNQPLTAILSNAQAANQFLSAVTPDLEEIRECLGGIIKNDRRAGEVIGRMRPLLRKEAADLAPISLNELAQSMLLLVANDAQRHQVALELVSAPALPIVHADPVQIQQVIVNLLVNAITAASTAGARPARVAVRTGLADGRVELRVRDSGKGIAPDDLGRIFDPFFTTKRDGLGMGLAISRSIIEAHRGRIWAENAADGGAIFLVQLPIQPKPVV